MNCLLVAKTDFTEQFLLQILFVFLSVLLSSFLLYLQCIYLFAYLSKHEWSAVQLSLSVNSIFLPNYSSYLTCFLPWYFSADITVTCFWLINIMQVTQIMFFREWFILLCFVYVKRPLKAKLLLSHCRLKTHFTFEAFLLNGWTFFLQNIKKCLC